MGGASFAEAAITAGSRIGWYFSVVSAIPSALFVLFVYALLSSGAWSGQPNWTEAGNAIEGIGLPEASVLVVLALAVGLLVHPLQFALVQLLEGYWGPSRVGRVLAVARIRRHRRRFHDMRDAVGACQEARKGVSRGRLNSRQGDQWVPTLVAEQELRRALQAYPENGRRIMPTRLGNVLRRFEDSAGSQYRLNAVAVAPHLAMIAPSAHLGYLRDATAQLDLAVRICTLSLLAFAITFVVLVTDGLWLLLAVAPYAIAYLSYRGAVVAAAEHGAVIATIIDLDRFQLYEALHLPLPADTTDERLRNRTLMDILAGSEGSIGYASGSDTSVELTTEQSPSAPT